jgi:hypothetical protein
MIVCACGHCIVSHDRGIFNVQNVKTRNEEARNYQVEQKPNAWVLPAEKFHRQMWGWREGK